MLVVEILKTLSILNLIPFNVSKMLLLDNIISFIFSSFIWIFSPHFGQINSSLTYLSTYTCISFFCLSNELACSLKVNSKFI